VGAESPLTRKMKKFIYVAALLLFVSVAVRASSDDDSSESDDAASDKAPSSTESKAGEAIKTLLQEKITQKFKEAANEVKGVLVKQLGDSLKSAHEAFNPPKQEKEVGKKVGGAIGAKTTESKTGAAKLHQNKANRHRKNSGPAAMPNTDAADNQTNTSASSSSSSSAPSSNLFTDPPASQPNVSVGGSTFNGSNLFPNDPDPSSSKSPLKPYLPAAKLPSRPASAVSGGRKCPKHLHVKVRLRFNRNKLCPFTVNSKK